jgi:hypothetical protein
LLPALSRTVRGNADQVAAPARGRLRTTVGGKHVWRHDLDLDAGSEEGPPLTD